MTKAIELTDFFEKRRVFSMEDDFATYVTADIWTTVAGSTGTVAAGDKINGQIALTTAATLDDEITVRSTKKCFQFLNNQPITAECTLSAVNSSALISSWFFGLASAVTTFLPAGGLDPTASYSGSAIYKRSLDANYSCQVSIAATKTSVLTGSVATTTATAFDRLRIEFRPITTTTGEITYWINGLQAKSNVSPFLPVKHAFTYNAGVAMYAFAGVHAGEGTATVANVDYIGVLQVRGY